MLSQSFTCFDFPALSDPKAGDNSWKLCGLAALKPRGRRAELIAPTAKSVALFGQGTWSAGQLDLK